MTTTTKNDTLIARAAIETDTNHGAVIAPIYLSSTFTFEKFKKIRKYDYTRSGNPTRDDLCGALAQIEKGYGAVATASGMAALLTVFHLVQQGETIVAPHDCYGGTYRQLTSLAEKGFFNVDFVNQQDDEALQQALAKNPKLILIETPSNPLMRVVDIEKICTLAHQNGAHVVADNTFLSPVLQNPIVWGVDFVVHSTTKYINGHSDVVGGAIIAKTKEQYEEIAWWSNNLGVTGAPFDSYLTLRGLRTVELRVLEQQKTAGKIAKFLDQHKNVGKVYYPGLETHVGHDIAKKQQLGFGSMISFEINGGEDKLERFFDSIRLLSLAESLGGTESLIAHPASMTHASMDHEAQLKAGITHQLIRLSIGLENAEDLIEDLDKALNT